MTAAKVMPVNLTRHMGLSRRAVMRQHLEIYSNRYQHTLPRPSTPSESSCPVRAVTPPQPSPDPISSRNSLSSGGTLKKKKRVVFADDKGLALTAVRIFDADPPESPTEDISPPEPPKDQPPVHNRILRFRLGFPQPSADLSSFFGGLTDSMVRLESCHLVGGLLGGTVRVSNFSLEKAVHIRITFNSWRTHLDVPCNSMQQFPGSGTELFAFTVPFPSDLNPSDRVEFCVSFRARSKSTLLWDDNGGQKYRILVDVVDPLVLKRPLMIPSPKLPHRWLKKKSHLVNYPACLSLTSPENVIVKPQNWQKYAIPLG